ncbi:hypothetical protein VitviT2T_024244 [Vitis vinifera]|uniref:Tubulin/FtsZ 2-layer sandwich domain-containing protein n=1 Tax=Vitis vinifera TaxID=29760 RepID=A0ABY9DHK3_VITVI|nr:hypothetical protein VitviT2T_024244 [Vitis vinifera]
MTDMLSMPTMKFSDLLSDVNRELERELFVVGWLVVIITKKSPYVQTAHRVSGLMLASHTSIRHLFSKCLS